MDKLLTVELHCSNIVQPNSIWFNLTRTVSTNLEARFWNWKETPSKIKMYFFKRTMFYLNFLKDKYKMSYICGTSKGKNHVYEKPQTTLSKKSHLTLSSTTRLYFFFRSMFWGDPVPLSSLHTPRSGPKLNYNMD